MKTENRIQVGTVASRGNGRLAGAASAGAQSGRNGGHAGRANRNVGVRSEHVQNIDGFWELSFAGQYAVLPQHQGLFYVAYLLAQPDAEPIAGADLAGEVFERFGEHEDFRPPIPQGYRNDARVAKILLRKQKRLEGIVDRDEEDIVVRVEALRELMVLDELKRIYFSTIAREAKNAGEVVSDTLRELHATLASAVDVRGNPQPVIRDFAMHLLHYVLMPSDRVSKREGVALFVYRPA
jgi:hypothetical protein